mmetsp:Transcript_169998/g.413255  ORF Transcript_169998/g.413255 Transcript_169998/m.413255 type:complete len:237 (+) Transcript_169998:867-1577(+)
MPPVSATIFFSATSHADSGSSNTSSNQVGHAFALATRRTCSSSNSDAVKRCPTASSNRMPSISLSRPAALSDLAKPPVPFHCSSYSEILSASRTRDAASAPSASSLASGFSHTTEIDLVAVTTRIVTGRSMRFGRGAEICTSAPDSHGSDSPAILRAAMRTSDKMLAGSMRSEAGMPLPPPMTKLQRPLPSVLHVAMVDFSASLTRYLMEYAVTDEPPSSAGGFHVARIVPLSASV